MVSSAINKIIWSRDYVLARDLRVGCSGALGLINTLLCTDAFLSRTKFVIWTFPLRFKKSIISGILTHEHVFAIGHNGSWSSWQEYIDWGFTVTTYYRIIETEQDWLELCKSNRNRLEGEIFIALVYNQKYLEEIKRLTLTNSWLRIPFFVTPEQIRLLDASYPKLIHTINPYSSIQEDRLRTCATAWIEGTRDMIDEIYGTEAITTDEMIFNAEIAMLKKIKRSGEVEKLYQYFIKNIDNPLSFLDKSLNT